MRLVSHRYQHKPPNTHPIQMLPRLFVMNVDDSICFGFVMRLFDCFHFGGCCFRSCVIPDLRYRLYWVYAPGQVGAPSERVLAVCKAANDSDTDAVHAMPALMDACSVLKRTTPIKRPLVAASTPATSAKKARPAKQSSGTKKTAASMKSMKSG
jgi:hypothetical protein